MWYMAWQKWLFWRWSMNAISENTWVRTCSARGKLAVCSYWYVAWRQVRLRQAEALEQRVTGTGAPNGEGLPTKRYLHQGRNLRRYTPDGTRHPSGDLEAATPGGTCPPLGNFAVAASVCWIFYMRDLQDFWWCFKGGIAGVPWVELGTYPLSWARDRG